MDKLESGAVGFGTETFEKGGSYMRMSASKKSCCLLRGISAHTADSYLEKLEIIWQSVSLKVRSQKCWGGKPIKITM